MRCAVCIGEVVSVSDPDRPVIVSRRGWGIKHSFCFLIGECAIDLIGIRPLTGGHEADAVCAAAVVETVNFDGFGLAFENAGDLIIRKGISVMLSRKSKLKDPPAFYRCHYHDLLVL